MFSTCRQVCALEWLLGFEVPTTGQPPACYLVRGHIQIMLCERNGKWEVGELSRHLDVA